MLAVRCLVFAVQFFNTRMFFRDCNAPTFVKAAYHVLTHMSRGRFPLFFATLFQISLAEGQIELQTFLMAFLLAQAREECTMMVESNADIAKFGLQLERNYWLWEEKGPSAACHNMCNHLLNLTSRSCTRSCLVLLPVLWTALGRPWAQACIMNRWIIGVAMGYILPLMALYLQEMMERHEFAKLKGLRVADLGSSLRQELPLVLRWVSRSLIVAAVCMWGW
eukprot:jgi/Botrbrau1/896/Bobra.0167s0017.2